MTADKPRGVRVRQGLALLAGGLALELLVGSGPLGFFWTPLVLGLAYLAAALAGGRSGGHWATGCALTGWGLGVVYAGEFRPSEIDVAGVYLAGAGLGVVAGALLASRGVALGALGLGATVAAGGLCLALSPRAPDVLADARTYALAVGAVGLLNLVLAWSSRSPAP